MDYYNEIDPFAAAWLRSLIDAGAIPDGVVDTRSIEDVLPDDLRAFRRCHFFAGIGVWAYALERAGWPADEPVWTGSCPCQPFSAAGKAGGFADQRHLWPHWHHLISECRPGVVLGEQVASRDGLGWLDLVHADLEAAGYAVGAVDMCAAGVGAPHIRQRLFFVGHADELTGRQGCQVGGGRVARGDAQSRAGLGRAGVPGFMAHSSSSTRLEGRDGRALGAERAPAERSRGAGALADDDHHGRAAVSVGGLRADPQHDVEPHSAASSAMADTATGGFWADAKWIACRDGKARPVEPGTFPLAHGAPARVGRLRGYGNAIVAPVAETFIRAYLDTRAARPAPAVRGPGLNAALHLIASGDLA